MNYNCKLLCESREEKKSKIPAMNFVVDDWSVQNSKNEGRLTESITGRLLYRY